MRICGSKENVREHKRLLPVMNFHALLPVLQLTLGLIAIVFWSKGSCRAILSPYFHLLSFRYRLSVGTSEKIQLSSLIAAFQVTRDLIVTEA